MRRVWIVQQDETPDNVVLGVFDDPDEADGYAETIKDDFPGHVIIEEYPLGYKLLTTHNLAALVDAGVILEWPAQALQAWTTTKNHPAKTTGPHRLHHRKNAAYAWRQTLFYLALSAPQDIAAFANDETLTHGLSSQVRLQADALLGGLRDVVETGAPPEHPFLGWVARSDR